MQNSEQRDCMQSSSYKYIQGTKEAKLKELKYDDEILTRGYKRNCKENEKLQS